MKTYSLAKSLRQLADILENMPNVDVSNLQFEDQLSFSRDKASVALNLRTLHALSKFSKKEWIDLINDFGFDLNYDPRDSSRNIYGKLMNFLDSNPDALDVLKHKSKERNRSTHSALSDALDVLLKDT